MTNKNVTSTMNNFEKFFLGLAGISGVLGLAVLVVFLVKVNQGYTYEGPINVEVIGVFGDFVGGIVGTLWALASVLLFFIALRVQTRELKETRLHFEGQLTTLKQQFRYEREMDIAENRPLIEFENTNVVNELYRLKMLVKKGMISSIMAINESDDFALEIKPKGKTIGEGENFFIDLVWKTDKIHHPEEGINIEIQFMDKIGTWYNYEIRGYGSKGGQINILGPNRIFDSPDHG